MQPKERVTVTLPAAVVATARRDVDAGRARSVSAWVTEAAEWKAQQEDLGDVLADLLEQAGGPSTDEERKWARTQLGL
jgi:antitoxin ParD1/3/4